MYQKIHEPCAVAGVYNKATFIPKKFLWKDRPYVVENITFVTNVTDGGINKRMYSVQVKANVYRLLFNRNEETWYMEEIWFD